MIAHDLLGLRAANLANFLRTATLRDEVKHWPLTTLRDRLIKICARIVRAGCSIAFQMAEVMVPRAQLEQILTGIAALRPPLPPPARY
ncbi:transposase [Roseomonas sp. HF4]|uniref:transposase n=1 Tax=Roseomonas sp. HF4 TaxID=2562313 RepID=UPI00148519FD|nr:transposase [Roseomonas sp. HF4]